MVIRHWMWEIFFHLPVDRQILRSMLALLPIASRSEAGRASPARSKATVSVRRRDSRPLRAERRTGTAANALVDVVGQVVVAHVGIAAGRSTVLRTHRKVMYESSNKKIATVTSKGRIKGIKKGVCYVYAYAQNGVAKKIRVTIN